MTGSPSPAAQPGCRTTSGPLTAKATAPRERGQAAAARARAFRMPAVAPGGTVQPTPSLGHTQRQASWHAAHPATTTSRWPGLPRPHNIRSCLCFACLRKLGLCERTVTGPPGDRATRPSRQALSPGPPCSARCQPRERGAGQLSANGDQKCNARQGAPGCGRGLERSLG